MEEKKEWDYKEGKVTLFPNKDKKEKQPDYTGHGMFKGNKFKISLWKNISQAGNPYVSGEVDEPYVPGKTPDPKPIQEETEIDPF